MLKHYIVILLNIALINRIESQCAFSGNLQTPPSTTNIVTLDVSGALNNDLSSPGQGVCGININFSHARIADLELFLVSPNGDTVQLVGPVGPQVSTQGTRWGISFLTCGTAPDPDVSTGGIPFNPVFNNLQDWGLFNNWNGSYHPHQGCLEDFNTGPVDGVWQLIIVNNNPFIDLPDVYSAILRDFVIFFCDSDGLDCFVCQANGGNIQTDVNQFCEGDEALRLNINRTFNGFPADPMEYSYLYMIFRDNELLDTVSLVDLRTYPAGNYQVCGLSVLNESKDSIPEIGNIFDPISLRDSLLGPEAPFCGKMSSGCLAIQISADSDTTFLETAICSGDSIDFGGQFYSLPSTYTWNGLNINDCDSVVVLELNVMNLSAISLSYDSLDCIIREITLRSAFLSNSFDQDELSFIWTDDGGNVIGTEQELPVANPGLYTLVIQGERDDLICAVVLEFPVYRIMQELDYFLIVPDTICTGVETEIFWSGPSELDQYNWNVTGPASIVGSDSEQLLRLNIDAGGDIEVCLSLSDLCITDTVFCENFYAVEIPAISFLYQDTVCDQTTDIAIIGGVEGTLTNTVFPSGGAMADVQSNGMDEFTILVTKRGDYEFVFEADISNCHFAENISIYFEPEPEFTVENLISTICSGASAEILFGNSMDEQLEFQLNWDGMDQTLTLLPGDSLIRIDPPLTPGNYTMTITGGNYANAPACLINATVQFSIEVPLIPEWTNSAEICNAEDTGQETIFDLRTLFTGNMVDPEFSNPANVGSGMLPVLDFSNVDPGNYTFPFTLRFSDECPLIEGDIILEVLECRCPDVEFINGTNSFCLDDEVNLGNYLLSTTTGEWQLVDFPDGSGGFSLIDGLFNVNEKVSGDYIFNYRLTGAPDGCPLNNELILNGIENFKTGETTQETIKACTGLDTTFQLFEYLVNFDTGGEWSFADGIARPEMLDEVSGELQPANLPSGQYVLTYSAPEIVECKDQPVTILLELTDSEQLNLPEILYISCNTQQVVLNAPSFILHPNYVFEWLIETNDTNYSSGEPNLNIDSDATVILQARDIISGCLLIDSTIIQVLENTITDLILDIQGPECNEPVFHFSIEQVVGGVTPYLFKLNDFPFTGQMQFRNLSPGDYTLLVQDANGCDYTTSFSVTSGSDYSIDAGENLYVTAGQEVMMQFQTDLASLEWTRLYWLVDGEIQCEFCETLLLTPFDNTTVEVVIEYGDGCILRDEVNIYVDERAPFYIPTGFSPNNDGTNDVLRIYPANDEVFIELWEIFDRWGNKVFERNTFPANDPNAFWDGSFKGRLLKPSVFVYKIVVKNSNGSLRFYQGETVIMY